MKPLKPLLRALVVLAGLLPAWVGAADEPAELSLIVFQEGAPVAGVEIRLDERTLGTTGSEGAWVGEVPAGRHTLALRRNGRVIERVDLLTDTGESVQIIADVAADGASARIDIEASGGGRAVTQKSASTQAEPGKLSGRIVSAESGEPVANAKVYFAGIEASTTTGDDGRYQAQVPAGTYAISVVHPDFASQTKKNVRVIAGKAVTADIELSPAGLKLADYTVTAPYVEGSVASVFSQQREEAGVSEVLGAEQMSRAGDSDAAEALGRVTGLTVEDGKFIVIRGQPERYTKTLFNGSPLPSPDPIKRIVPLDLFPTSVLSSISVEKSYSASMPASFGGGLIDIETVGAPAEPFVEASVSIGGNTQSTGEQGLTYDGGGTDSLGVDDGTRAPSSGLDAELDGVRGDQQRLEAGARAMPNTWAVEETTLPPDYGLGLSAGTKAELLGGDFGIRGSLKWSQSYRKTERIERDFGLRGDGSLSVRNDQVERRTDRDIDLGGFLTARIDWADHQLASNTFLIRKTKQRTQITAGTRVVSNDLEIQDFLLDWNERELLAQQFTGEHDLGFVDVDWRAMVAQASRDNPDRRSYLRERRQDSDDPFQLSEQRSVRRRFVNTEDEITSFDIDLERRLIDAEGLKLDLRGGFSSYTQDRTSRTRRVGLDADRSESDLTAPIEEIVAPENLGDSVEVNDDTLATDNYLGDASIDAVYLEGEADWTEAFRLTGGVRQESSNFTTETFRSAGSGGGERVRGGFERSDTLPSVSATWRFAEQQQLRASYGRSISRPVLNELSPATYFDPDTGEQFDGNPDLVPAEIDSIDLRWSWYPSPSELVAVGAFTKEYSNPLEERIIPVGGSSPKRQVRNADAATVEGVEGSIRVDLPRLGAWLGSDWAWAEDMYAQANGALIESEVILDDAGRATDSKRPLQGQADELFNLQLGYQGSVHSATLAVNYTGDRLAAVGQQGQPNVIEEARAVVDAKYGYQWSDALSLELEAGNLLDRPVERTQGGRTAERYEPGIDFSLGLEYRF
jgi:TonB-dependent receptor